MDEPAGMRSESSDCRRRSPARDERISKSPVSGLLGCGAWFGDSHRFRGCLAQTFQPRGLPMVTGFGAVSPRRSNRALRVVATGVCAKTATAVVLLVIVVVVMVALLVTVVVVVELSREQLCVFVPAFRP